MFTEEIKAVQTQISLIGRVVINLPLQEFAEEIKRADVLGPILDPPAWRDGEHAMREWKEMITPLIEFQRVARKLITPERGEE